MKFFVAGITPAWSISFTVSPAGANTGSKWLIMASLSNRVLDICVTAEAGMRHLQIPGIEPSSFASLRKMRAEAIASQAKSTCHAPLLDFDFFFEQASRNILQLRDKDLVSSEIIDDMNDVLLQSLEILSPTAFATYIREQGHFDILDNVYRYMTHPEEVNFWADYWSVIIGKITHGIHLRA